VNVQKRIAELEAQLVAWNQKAATWIASPESAKMLQGYRELTARIAELEAQTDQLTASLETASSAVILLKQQQREGWAQLASGQQPVAWMTFDGEGGYDFRQFAENENYRDDFIQRNGEKYAWVVEPLYAHPAPSQQPIASGQEPDMQAICAALGFDPTNHHNAAKCPYCRPAAPAQQPLSDDQILDFGPGQPDAIWSYEDQLYFAREIEAAHGIKEKP
jgi:hypothetical protein